jgi:hypothetical protein
MSDAGGYWETAVATDDIADLDFGDQAGYLFLRAEGEGLPGYLNSFSVRHFTVTNYGQRPAGSGQIQVSVTFESDPPRSRLGGIGWRRVGGERFYSPYSYGIALPATLPISILADGEFEVAISIADDLEVRPAPNIRQVSGEALCHGGPADPCARPKRLAVQTVTVANAEVVHADFVLRSKTSEEPTEPPGSQLQVLPQPGNGRIALLAGASALLAILIVGTAVLGYRGAGRKGAR